MRSPESEHQQYGEFQASRRPGRVESLVTLVLATFDLGLSPVGQAVKGELSRRAESKEAKAPNPETAEVTELAPRRTRANKLATLATESTELGYSQAA